MKPIAQCSLYAFVDTGYLRGRDAVDLAQQLCDGGADLIQLRAKQSSSSEILTLAEKLLPVAAAAGIGLVINDHPDIAAKVGAPACHLGQEDFFDSGKRHVDELEAVKRVKKGAALHIGLSTHAPEQALRAVAAGAAYIAIGPVFPTPTKPQARPVTLEYVRWAASHVPVPWFAIGGITLSTVDAVLEAGARRICVVSAILDAPDVVRACKKFKDRLLSAGRDS